MHLTSRNRTHQQQQQQQPPGEWSWVCRIRIHSQDAPCLLLLIFTLLPLSSFFHSALANAKCAIISITVINVCVVRALFSRSLFSLSPSLSFLAWQFIVGLQTHIHADCGIDCRSHVNLTIVKCVRFCDFQLPDDDITIPTRGRRRDKGAGQGGRTRAYPCLSSLRPSSVWYEVQSVI